MGIFDKIRSIQKLNEDALRYVDKTDCSWHDTYKNSSYIYIGNLDKDVTEGDIIVMFSQYGEPIDINLVRDEDTGESKGYCFLAYADQRSTILAVDNFIGYKLSSRPLVVDHVLNYRLPKKYTDMENKEKNEYKPSGAEGKGIGVYNILEKEKTPKKDAQNRKEEKENADEDELWAMDFEKSLKGRKERREGKVRNEEKEEKEEKEKQRTRNKGKTIEKYESSDDISERSLSKKRKEKKKRHRKNECKEKKSKTIYKEKRRHSDIGGEYENPCVKKRISKEKHGIMCSDKYREQRRRYYSPSSSSSSSSSFSDSARYDKYKTKHKRYRYKLDGAYKERKRNISKERTRFK